MKLLSIISIFFICSLTFSQKKNSDIIGEWKLTAFKSQNISYSSSTDTLIYLNGYDKILPEIIPDFSYKKLDSLREATKNEYSKKGWVFKKNGQYLMTQNGNTSRLEPIKPIVRKKLLN